MFIKKQYKRQARSGDIDCETAGDGTVTSTCMYSPHSPFPKELGEARRCMNIDLSLLYRRLYSNKCTTRDSERRPSEGDIGNNEAVT